MQSKPKFSVALIAKNESKTLPRLLGSLASFKERGGEIILVDTGSTDNTVQVAKDLGCQVTEVGERFIRTITDKEARYINNDLTDVSEADVVKAGDTLFDYSAARNFAASLTSNDMVAMPDCDEEYTKLDIDKLNELIDAGAEQFEYQFVFSHDPEGNELVKFFHSKFYNRQKMKWVGIIHEVLSGEGNKQTLEENVIKLEHWQNQETNRGHYLKGLALSVHEDPNNDRNLHYLGRELMYVGRPKSAIKVLEQHIALDRWPAEKSQSQIHIGDAYMKMGDAQKAVHSYIEAFNTHPFRREPMMKIAEYYYQNGMPDHTLAYVAAAMQIKGDQYYANFQPYYENVPHEWMYWALWQKEEFQASKQHFDICLAYQPFNPKYLHDFRFYYELPKLTFVASASNTEEELVALTGSIKSLNYPQEKISIVKEGEQLEFREREWTVYTQKGITFDPQSVMCAFKQAMDNNKLFMAFNDGDDSSRGTYMISSKLSKKLRGNWTDGEDLWKKLTTMGQSMRCGRAIIN